MRSRRSKAWRQRKQVREMEAILDQQPPPPCVNITPAYYGIVAPYHQTTIKKFQAQVEMYSARVKLFQAQTDAMVEWLKQYAFKKK